LPRLHKLECLLAQQQFSVRPFTGKVNCTQLSGLEQLVIIATALLSCQLRMEVRDSCCKWPGMPCHATS
jgi:hypothetical protein